MESYLNQLYEHINNKNEEYEKMLDQHYMDKFNITKEKLEYLKEYLDCDKFIICNKVDKINGLYIECDVTDLNLSSRDYEKNCLYYLNYNNLLRNYNHSFYKCEKLNRYLIQHYINNNLEFILILNEFQAKEIIRLLNTRKCGIISPGLKDFYIIK